MFHEQLYYADGLDGGCWNGNVSTVKWRSGSESWQGYNLKYDGSNRLYGAVYGSGNNLTSYPDYFSENMEYDCNGNITRLLRSGLADNLHGSFGLVDNLFMTYTGNRLTSVRDSASHLSYANATDFSGVTGQEYPLTYDDAGALTSDAGRGMARIDYDLCGNPVRIQFTDGSVTRYIYSAAGEKLRVTHLTAVPNITVPIGTARELAPSEILSADSTDYLLGGTLTLRNGRIDKYQFEEGYCQAVRSTFNPSQDGFTFYYYDRDHLGSVRQVIEAEGTDQGTIVQKMNYYPSGTQLCDGRTDSDVQPLRYNGKELDKMHGLCTYDYGARQYNPVTARWDRMDPLCEKYYSASPYAYCGGDPVNAVDPDGKKILFVNGYWASGLIGRLIGSSQSGKSYWGTGFDVAAQNFFHDWSSINNSNYMDGSSLFGCDMSGSVSDKLLLRKRAIIETVNDELKNIAQVEYSRHRCFENFVVNMLGALAAYCCFPKKTCINVQRTLDTQLSLF